VAALPRKTSSVEVVGHGRFLTIGVDAVSSQKELNKWGSSEYGSLYNHLADDGYNLDKYASLTAVSELGGLTV